MVATLAIIGNPAEGEDIFAPLARKLAGLDLAIITNADMTDLDYQIAAFEATLEEALLKAEGRLEEFARTLREASTLLPDEFDLEEKFNGVIDKCVENYVDALKATKRLRSLFKTIKKATKQLPRTRRMLLPRLDRAEKSAETFEQETDNLLWRLQALRAEICGYGSVTDALGPNDDLWVHLRTTWPN